MPVLTKNEVCPFVHEPFDKCYCFNLTSRYIKSAIYYCGNHYTSCEIFRKNTAKKNPHDGKKTVSEPLN